MKRLNLFWFIFLLGLSISFDSSAAPPPPPPPPPSSSATLPAAIAQYRLNEASWNGSVNEVTDSSGNNLHGRAAWGANTSDVSPARGNIMGTCNYGVFDGVDDFAWVADHSLLGFDTNFAVGAWVKIDSFPASDYKTIVSKDENYEFHVSSTGHILWWWQNSANQDRAITSTIPITAGVWTHVAISYEYHYQKIFINGVEAGSAGVVENLARNNDPVQIGSDQGYAGRYFNGDIDEVNIFNQPLNSIQINKLMALTQPCSGETFNCIADNFVTPGALSTASWEVGSSGGTFGNPTIVDSGRLRLTDASQGVATFTNSKHRFTAANNRIEVEFDYYAYDRMGSGDGADGMAVIFSDASIDPVSGSAGGSLGYGQGSSSNGFAGGWLGVGIDEYGNFSSPTDGRNGGPGQIKQSVSLRGSGVGTTGYPYLAGTGALSPAIDLAGNTPGPAHRYKITIDSTAGGNKSLISIARNTGSGFLTIIDQFDIFEVNPSQAAVPDNWIISFTASTGGLTNIHEIGALQLCATQYIKTFVDHYEISHTNDGLTCEASEITISAHDENHDSIAMLNDTSIAVTTIPAVSGIVTSPTVILQGTSSTSINLQQSSLLENIDIDVSDGLFSDDEGSAEDPRISFFDTAFRFYADGINTSITPIDTQISGKPTTELPSIQSLGLRAVRTNDDTKACEAALTGIQKVNVAYTCKNPSSCSTKQLSFITPTPASDTQSVTGTNDGSALAYIGVDMNFDANGSAPFDFNFPDAGKIQLHASLTIPAADPEPGFTLVGSSNEFVVRPFAFDLIFPDVNFNAADAGGSKYVRSGDDFIMQVAAKNWEKVDDDGSSGGTSGDGIPDDFSAVSGNETAINFGQELSASNQTLAISHTLKLPTGVGTSAGILTSSAIETSSAKGLFIEGLSSNSTLTWSEVGIIDIDASLTNYLSASGANIKGEEINVGRFYPAFFSVITSTLTDSCGTFSYMGQTGIDIVFSLEAQNTDNIKTVNYEGGFAKMIPNTGVDFVVENANNGGNYDRLNITSSSGIWSHGVYGFDGDASFSRAASKLPDGPYISLQVGIQLTDDNDDNLSALTGLDMNAGTSAICSSGGCNAKKLSGNLDLRFGQLKLSNAFGPETSPLDMPVQTQYFNGTGFVVNSDDHCTNLSAANLIALSRTGNLAENDTTPSLVSDISAGIGVLQFSEVGLGNEGSEKYEYNTADWLKTENDANASYDDFPFGTVTFGQYRGNDRMIYWREVVR